MSERQYKRARRIVWPLIKRLVELGERPMPSRREFQRMVRAVVRKRRLQS